MPDRSDHVRIPAWAIACALSLLLHLALLWSWQSVPRPPAPEGPDKGATTVLLSARLAPVAGPPAVPAPPREAAGAPSPADAARRKAAPPLAPPPAPRAPAVEPSPQTTAKSPSSAPPPAAPADSAPAAARAAEPGDFSAMVAANQRRRGPIEAPAAGAARERAEDSETARSERDVAANLGTLKAPSPGENTRRGGGVFQLRRVGFDDAEFLFFGWNKDMGRNNTQLVEVRRGANPDIRIAVVRRMIAIIREHEKGDFLWDSRRLKRNVNLSARLADSAELEAFLLAEFF